MIPQNRWWIAPLLALGLLPTATGCGQGHGAESKAGSEAKKPLPVPVTVADLQRKSVERSVPIEGTLKAWEGVTVSAKKGGRVVRILHDMGDRVAPGELLVELETIDAELAVKQARAKFYSELVKLGITQEQAEQAVAKYGISEGLFRGEEVDRGIEDLPAIKQARLNVTKARQDYARQKSLHDRGVGTLQDLQNTENALRIAEVSLDIAIQTARTTVANALAGWVALDVALRDLSELKVVAPNPTTRPGESEAVEYAVTRRMVSEGQLLKDGEAVYELVIEDPIRLWANVPERYRPEIVVGQKVRLSAMSRPGETFEGEVSRINPAVDPVSRTFQVEARVPNADGRLRPGGFAKGEVVTRADADAVIVPIQSVYTFAGSTLIFLVEGDTVHGIPITVGRQVGTWVEVIPTEGSLPAKGQVVTTGQTKLAEGTVVVIRDPSAEDEPKSDAVRDVPKPGEPVAPEETTEAKPTAGAPE